jgi:hypothetical protein
VGDEPVANVNFRLSAGGEVTGIVQGPDGQSVTGTLVSTAPLENRSPGRIPAGLSEASTVANGDGTYRLEPLAPGEYTLYAAAPGCAEARQERVVVREGKTTKVDFTLTDASPQASRPDRGPELVVKLRTERVDNRFIDPDADLPLTLAVWNRAKETRELDVAYTVTDGDGGRVAEGRDHFAVGPQRVTPFTFTVRPGQRGVFHTVVRLQGGEVDLTKTLDFEVQRPGQAVAEAVPPALPSAIAIRAEATPPEGVFEIGGELPSFRVVVDYQEAPYQPLTLRIAVRNEQGHLVTEVQQPFATEQFRYTRCPVQIPVAVPGHYQVEFRLEAQEDLATTTATFSVRERAVTTATAQ